MTYFTPEEKELSHRYFMASVYPHLEIQRRRDAAILTREAKRLAHGAIVKKRRSHYSRHMV